VATSSTSYAISDVYSGVTWSFSFFLELLACSPVLFLWAYNGLDVSGFCVSMHVSCPISSSIGISCVYVLTSYVCTCFVVPLCACYVHSGSSVEQPYGFLCVILFFWIGLLPPTGPVVVFFLLLVPFLPICCGGTVMSCVQIYTMGTIFGITSTLHSSGHSSTSICITCIIM